MSEAQSVAPLKAALAGCGGVSRWTLDVARMSHDFKIVALQDVDEKAAVGYGQQYGIDRRTAKFEELLSGVDFVIINTPNHLHLEQARLAAAAGLHCLVQKPVTKNYREAQEMLKLSQSAQVKIGVTMMELGHPLNHQMRAMIQAGVIGEPCVWQSCHAHDLFLRNPPAASNWRRDREKVGGAAFIQLAVHHLNLAMWLLDRPIVSVSAQSESGRTIFDQDESTATVVSFGKGLIGTFVASYATTGMQLAIHGTGGYLRLFNDTLLVKGSKPFEGELFKYLQVGQEAAIKLENLRGQVAKLQAGHDVHNRFARWVQRNEPFSCPVEHGVRDMKIVDAVYQSIATKKTISLE